MTEVLHGRQHEGALLTFESDACLIDPVEDLVERLYVCLNRGASDYIVCRPDRRRCEEVLARGCPSCAGIWLEPTRLRTEGNCTETIPCMC